MMFDLNGLAKLMQIESAKRSQELDELIERRRQLDEAIAKASAEVEQVKMAAIRAQEVQAKLEEGLALLTQGIHEARALVGLTDTDLVLLENNLLHEIKTAFDGVTPEPDPEPDEVDVKPEIDPILDITEGIESDGSEDDGAAEPDVEVIEEAGSGTLLATLEELQAVQNRMIRAIAKSKGIGAGGKRWEVVQRLVGHVSRPELDHWLESQAA